MFASTAYVAGQIFGVTVVPLIVALAIRDQLRQRREKHDAG